jgi:hypothetical protein
VRSLSWEVSDQVRGQVWSLVRGQALDQVSDQARDLVRDQVWDLVGSPVEIQVWGWAWDQEVNSPPGEGIQDQVGDEVKDEANEANEAS